MTIKTVIAQVLKEAGELTNHQLQKIVPKIINCTPATVMRELRHLDYRARALDRNGSQSQTWVYSLA